MPFSLERFRPIYLSDMIRVGGPHDGGYVINERLIRCSQYVLSFGVSDDWSFELDLLNRNPDIKVFCFDHSVSKDVFRSKAVNALSEILSLKFALQLLLFKVSSVRREVSALKYWMGTYSRFSRFVAENNVRFHAQGISNVKAGSFITFAEALQSISPEGVPENSVLVKMDIEQWEFRVIPDLLKFAQYISGLVIEFHDLDILWAEFVALTEKIREHFEITHIHGNNYGGLIPNSATPSVLEITFLKKALLREKDATGQVVTYPVPGLDFPNNRLKKDYPLVFG